MLSWISIHGFIKRTGFPRLLYIGFQLLKNFLDLSRWAREDIIHTVNRTGELLSRWAREDIIHTVNRREQQHWTGDVSRGVKTEVISAQVM